MIADLNRLVEHIEQHLGDELDLGALAREAGTTEYHLRRMFSTLTGLPLSEYVRRRRMTLAAADLVAGEPVLETAVRYGYGSTEAFGRAFAGVHGSTPAEVRRDGGPLSTQQRLRFHLTVEGTDTMDTRIIEKPAFALIGHSARVPLIHRGVNPHIQSLISSLPPEQHERLKQLSGTEPHGLLQVSADVDPDYTEGSELTYLHGVALAADAARPADLDVIEVEAGAWAVFRNEGEFPAVLQQTWAATATEWFPSNPWRLRPGPSIVAVLDRAADFSTATTELWLPVERA